MANTLTTLAILIASIINPDTGVRVDWHLGPSGLTHAIHTPTYQETVQHFFPEDPSRAWQVLLCEGDMDKDGLPDTDLIDLTRTGGLGELTPWQIHPGNFPALKAYPQPGNFWQQTRLARQWYDRIGGWRAPGGWSCAF